ncbi:MAG: hypothetical protein JXJ22_17380 [Bacteroidales bacterium]|nr:hypothetical protein [Bacteroidales bacterium]
MAKDEENIEFIDRDQEVKEINPFTLKNILSGSLLTIDGLLKQLPFILFLTMLAIFYIANRYHAERLVRKSDSMRTEVINLRAEQITTASELMRISKPSEVEKLVREQQLGLTEAVDPPVKLIKKRK